MKYEPDQFLAFSQEHYTTQFPNPERIGCPVPGKLTSLIWSGHLPDAQLREHLFACSECFTEYRAQLAAYQQQATSPTTLLGWQRWRSFLSAKMAFVFGVLVITSISGWVVWRQMKVSQQPEVARGSTPDKNSTPTLPMALTEKEEKAEPKSSRPAAAPTPVIAKSVIRKIELNNYVVLRDVKTGTPEEKTIRLTPEMTHLNFVLPEGSTKGRYTVRLIDAFGRPLNQSQAVSPNGKMLTVTLDLRAVKANSYRLQIAHGKEAPDYYPVTVTEKHIRNK